MADSSSEIQEEVRLDHKHSYSYVYPAPASKAMKDGEYPYMICGCGDTASIVVNLDRWWVDGKGDWQLAPPLESVL